MLNLGCGLLDRGFGLRYGFNSYWRSLNLGFTQFWPMSQVIIRAQITTCDSTCSCTLNRHALLKWNSTLFPISNSCDGDAKYQSEFFSSSNQPGSLINS